MVEKRGRPFNPVESNIPPEKGGTRFNVRAQPSPSSTPTRPQESPQPPTQEPTKKKSRVFSLKTKVASFITAALALPAVAWGIEHYVSEDNKDNASSAHQENIGSDPGLTSEVPQLQGLSPYPQSIGQPSAEADTKQVNPEKAVKKSNPNPIKRKEFEVTPPNRIPSEIIYSQNTSSIDQLPVIKEHTEIHPQGDYNNFQPGIGFRLEERPAISHTYRRVTDGVAGPPVETVTPRNAYIGINGYVIVKEIHPDGNVFLAVYVPGKNGLPSQDDLDKSILLLKNTTDDGNEGKISGAIVWIKAENFEGYSEPFVFSSGWNENTTLRGEREKVTNIPEDLFRYIEIGDPVRAGAILQMLPWAENLLVKNYQEKENHLIYKEAEEKYLSIVNSNAEILQRMLADTKTGGVSLEEQFETKRYVLQVDDVRFVPRD